MKILQNCSFSELQMLCIFTNFLTFIKLNTTYEIKAYYVIEIRIKYLKLVRVREKKTCNNWTLHWDNLTLRWKHNLIFTKLLTPSLVCLVLCRLENKNPRHQHSQNQQPTISPASKMCCWHRTFGCGKSMSDLTWGPSHKRELMPNTSWMARNRRLDSPETWVELDWSKEIQANKSMKRFLMIFCSTPRPGPCPVIIREATSHSRWENVQTGGLHESLAWKI